METRIFPQFLESSETQKRASYEKKCIFHERLLYHYLMKKIEGWNIKDFLEKERIEDYILYALTDFTNLFVKDLEKNGGRRPLFICDKNAEKFSYNMMGYEVSTLKKMIYLYKNGKVKKIIVMSVLHENEIITELLKEGMLLNDIISVISVLYS